jgi:DNA-binding PadR family transcriptional regulator
MASDVNLGHFEQIVLLAILRLGETAYGAAIRREIADRAERSVSAGALYTTLTRLEQKALVTSIMGSPTPERGGKAKRFYWVTHSGKQALVAAQHAYRSLLTGLALLED